jgi:hypothetical protein
MESIKNVTTIVVRGGTVEIRTTPDLTDEIEFDDEQADSVSDQGEGEVVFDGYSGPLRIPESAAVTLRVEDARVSGRFCRGRIDADNILLDVVASGTAAAEEEPRTRAAQAVAILKDLVGIAGSIAIFWMIFRAVPFFKDPNEYFVWQVVLGSGAYYGFSGRWISSLVIAVLAIVAGIVDSDVQGWRLYAYALVKLAVFLAIMGGGKWLRDYLERFSREGYRGMKNRFRTR